MSEEINQPQRLTWLKMENSCMFCSEPKGGVYVYNICPFEKIGFFSCDQCKEKAQKAVLQWTETFAYGKAGYLKNKTIKIKRSSGMIEDGWILDTPFSRLGNDNQEEIHCYNKEEEIGRWCKMSEIISLNPPVDK